MTIIRTFHDKNNPYTLLNNQVLFDNNLSNSARGLWAQCMARKDNWTFYMYEMTKNTSDGKDAISSQINELIRAGYVARLQIKERRNGKLVFKCVDYIFFESKITFDKKQEFLEHFRTLCDSCTFLEPKSPTFKNKLPQPGFPATESPDPENPPLVNTDAESTDRLSTIIAPPVHIPSPKQPTAGGNNNFSLHLQIKEKITNLNHSPLVNPPLLGSCGLRAYYKQTNYCSSDNISYVAKNSYNVDPPEAEIPRPPTASLPAAANNNFYECLNICTDLSPKQKRLLMKYPEPLVTRAVRYAYHPTTQIDGGPIGRIKLLQYFLKNPDDFTETERQLDNPETKLTKKERLVGRFKRGQVYNGFEYFQDSFGVGFLRSDMPQPYSVRWDSLNFEKEFLAILKKCGID